MSLFLRTYSGKIPRIIRVAKGQEIVDGQAFSHHYNYIGKGVFILFLDSAYTFAAE
jgi:hypothetical protein